jgi:protein-L-isoaspartate(D-aspartate) O-methyltransferase
MENESFHIAREMLINDILVPNGIRDERLLEAMRMIPRHRFLPARQIPYAYENRSLGIGYRQTMLPPLVIAQMLQALHLTGTENILEIGTGTGYLTALLVHLGAYVYSLERIPQLAERAADILNYLGYRRLDLHIGDGSQGLPDMAPFDVIVVSASVPRIPKPLAIQLDEIQGRMILPVGEDDNQSLRLLYRTGDHWHSKRLAPVQLPPLVGRYGNMPPARSS